MVNKDMVKAIKFGRMVQGTKDSGPLIKLTGKENLFTRTETSMKESGLRTKPTGKEHTSTLTAPGT